MINASLPLMFCGLGVALTFKMNLNNIGAEGQYAMGAIFGGAFVLYGPEIRGIGGGIILAVMCFLGGAFWALLCAIPKAYWNVNESITTLMLNYIALIILSYLVLGPWKMPGQNVGQTKRIPVGLEIPEINGISAGIILGIVAAVVIFLAYKYTTDGYQLSVIRSSQNYTPVILLSGRGEDSAQVKGLELGADDYITKPFDMEEVLARIESNLRRIQFQNSTPSSLKCNDLVLDLDGNRAMLQGAELPLTAKEFAILELLMKYPDKIFSKANLFQSVWNTEYISEDNTLNVHISNLRNKMKAICPDKEFIDTVWGIGYRLHKAEG